MRGEAERGEGGMGNGPEFDLVLLDWMLPGQDGMDMLRALRRGGNRVPVMLLTARDSKDDIAEGLDGGAGGVRGGGQVR